MDDKFYVVFYYNQRKIGKGEKSYVKNFTHFQLKGEKKMLLKLPVA